MREYINTMKCIVYDKNSQVSMKHLQTNKTINIIICTFLCEIYLKVQGIDIPDIPASISQLIRGPGI